MDFRDLFDILDLSHYYMSSNKKIFPAPVLPYAPVRQDERQHYLNLLLQQYLKSLAKNKQDERSDHKKIAAEIVKREHDVCKRSRSRMEYMSTVKRLMYNLLKYGAFDKDKVAKDRRQRQKIVTSKCNQLGIPDDDELYKRLEKLCISKSKLDASQYVTEVPQKIDDAEVPDFIECEHCHSKFSMHDQFDKKFATDDKGCLIGPSVWHFHPGKIQFVTDSNLLGGRIVRNRSYRTSFYSCCHESLDESSGCCTNAAHVFKFKDKRFLNWAKPFKTISQLRKELNIRNSEPTQQLRRSKIKAIGIDCEMCFTDLGFELMKVSAVDFRTLKPILNNLVVPEGDKVVDLNTHVSGVDCVPKSSDLNTLTFDQVMVRLAQLTDEDTIVIGHGLENDLNVLRLIYPRIVDTAILFSENQIDPMRKDPLKKLAWKYLSKNVQMNEHDPLEDAILPVQITKKVLCSKKYE